MNILKLQVSARLIKHTFKNPAVRSHLTSASGVFLPYKAAARPSVYFPARHPVFFALISPVPIGRQLCKRRTERLGTTMRFFEKNHLQNSNALSSQNRIRKASKAKKQPPYWVTALRCWHFPIVPGRCQPSIFGIDELNFRVRDGNGWTLIIISTNYCLSRDDLIIIPRMPTKCKSFFEIFSFLFII